MTQLKKLFFLPVLSSSLQLSALSDVKTPTQKIESKDECSLNIFGNDRMQFVDTADKIINKINVPNTCETFILHFAYKGKLPSSVMGHNIVITEEKNKSTVTADALKQGKKNNYLPAGQVAKDFVIAASKKTLGGAEEDLQTEDITVDMKKVDPEKLYTFFCAFPGHSLMMKGSFIKEKPKSAPLAKKLETQAPKTSTTIDVSQKPSTGTKEN